MKKGIGPKALGSPFKQDKVEVKRLELHKQVKVQPKVRDKDIYQISDPKTGGELTDPSISDKHKLMRSKGELQDHRMSGKFEKPYPGFENVPKEGDHALDKISYKDIESGNFPASRSLNPGGFDKTPSTKPHKKSVRQAKIAVFFGKFKRKNKK